MKKIFVVFMMMLASVSSIHAFDFDGIDLNLPYTKVAMEISKRGYNYDADRNCLRGLCQGKEIFLQINYQDVRKKGMVGQLKVEIPSTDVAEAYDHFTEIFNIIYHQIANTEQTATYHVENAGTQLVVSKTAQSVILTYNTPFYKAAK